MNKLTQEQLEAIRKRAEQATLGPWTYVSHSADIFVDKAGAKPLITSHCEHSDYESWYEFTRNEDAEFCANAREDVPALLAEVERLRAELAVAKETGRREFVEEIFGNRIWESAQRYAKEIREKSGEAHD